jgi:hypothetical protein
MTTLAAKEEAYARERAAGKGPSAAYRASRDCSKMSAATIKANAKKLERKASIKARIEELGGGESREGGESSTAAAPGGTTYSRKSQQMQAKNGALRPDALPGGAAEPPKKGGLSARYRVRARARGGSHTGRPTVYTEEIATSILTRLAAGEPLRTICRDERMPAESTVRAWAHDPNHPIAARYAQAREVGFFSLADEILQIADDSRNDFVDRITRSGEVERVLDEEAIARSRMRIAARQWLLAKALPHTFGDKVEQNLTVTDITPRPALPSREVMDEDLRKFRQAVVDYHKRAAAEAEAQEAGEADTNPNGGRMH